MLNPLDAYGSALHYDREDDRVRGWAHYREKNIGLAVDEPGKVHAWRADDTSLERDIDVTEGGPQDFLSELDALTDEPMSSTRRDELDMDLESESINSGLETIENRMAWGGSDGGIMDPDDKSYAPMSGRQKFSVYRITWTFPGQSWERTERMERFSRPSREDAKRHVAKWNSVGISEVQVRSIEKIR